MMINLQVISKEHHRSKFWNRPKSLLYASKTMVVPILAKELQSAAMCLPLGFTKTEEGYKLVAILGFENDTNAFVSKDGVWLGKYVPAVFRGFPFSLVDSDDDKQVLCISEDYILEEETENAEPFFDKDGAPTLLVQDTLKFLNQLYNNNKVTEQICELLQQNDLIEPWPMKIESDGSDTIDVQGLFRINQNNLTALSPEVYPELMSSGAMLLAYSQLLSMQHANEIIKHIRAKKSEANKEMPKELDFDFMNQDESINFDDI